MEGRADNRVSRRAFDYLLAIYMASLGEKPARLVDISEILGVSAPSAHEYLTELINQGLVAKAGRGLYRLTPAGKRILMKRIWIHGVLEEMLVRIFKIEIDAACSIASQIDLEIGEGNVEKICSMLGHPRKCPHGYIIPHIDIGESITDHTELENAKPCIKIPRKIGP
ncbi:MAG TPA: metal-dependent transcriptional regulator [Sulfolobales archaeon]|nr:metal-dependent transcriptional regulator [Sulfolobales archaeon]